MSTKDEWFCESCNEELPRSPELALIAGTLGRRRFCSYLCLMTWLKAQLEESFSKS